VLDEAALNGEGNVSDELWMKATRAFLSTQ
jgi:hypothetical protein